LIALISAYCGSARMMPLHEERDRAANQDDSDGSLFV
jgi:hypothetical protein